MAQHQNGYTRFVMKWSNRCQKCNMTLEKGVVGWGTKNSTTGKWKFLCDSCIGEIEPKTAWDSNATADTQKDGSLEALEAAIGEALTGGNVSNMGGDPAKQAIDEIAGKRPPTVLEVLKANAVYGGA